MLARLKREVDPKVLVVDTGRDTVQAKKDPSTSLAQHHVQQSPTQSKASNITIFDVDAMSDTIPTFRSQHAGKRKASSALSDDEIEIMEGVVLPAKKQKSSKVHPTAKTRARKK